MFDDDALRERMASRVSVSRLAHTERVARIAAMLATLWGLDDEQVRRAAWLHDCARNLTRAQQRALILPSRWEEAAALGWHGPAGAVLARCEFGATDMAVLAAIKLHSVPQPDGSLLTKLIYVADKLDPGRDVPLPGEEELVAQCAAPDPGLLYALDMVLRDRIRRRRPIWPAEVVARTTLLTRLGLGQTR